MLKITKHKNNHIELHLGPYFRGFLSTVSGFLAVVLIFGFIFTMVDSSIQQQAQKFTTLFVLLVLIGVFVNLFLGFEGVEFDVEQKRFRHYTKKLGMKAGKWKDLTPYTVLCLSAQYNSGGRTLGGRAGRHRSLEINLASTTKKAVLLAECRNYKEAESALQRLNSFLQLEIKDFVKEDYMKPSPRR